MAAASYSGAQIMNCEGRRTSRSVECEFSWREWLFMGSRCPFWFRIPLGYSAHGLSLHYAARSLAGHSSLQILETIENVQDRTQILVLWRQHLRGWMLPVCPYRWNPDRCSVPEHTGVAFTQHVPDCRPISYTTHMIFIKSLFPVVTMQTQQTAHLLQFTFTSIFYMLRAANSHRQEVSCNRTGVVV